MNRMIRIEVMVRKAAPDFIVVDLAAKHAYEIFIDHYRLYVGASLLRHTG